MIDIIKELDNKKAIKKNLLIDKLRSLINREEDSDEYEFGFLVNKNIDKELVVNVLDKMVKEIKPLYKTDINDLLSDRDKYKLMPTDKSKYYSVYIMMYTCDVDIITIIVDSEYICLKKYTAKEDSIFTINSIKEIE